MFVQPEPSAASVRAMDYDATTALARLIRHNGPEPLVVGQLGQSLDGRIATPTGASKYINGHEALCHLHRIRAAVDAVVVGVGTAIADNPQLTTRHVSGDSPARVVIDPKGRMPQDAAMLSDAAAPVLTITKGAAAAPEGADQIDLAANLQGGFCPNAITKALSARGYTKILIEGGAETLARFINAGAVHQLHLMIAPMILGSGKTGLNLAPIENLEEALRPSTRTMRFKDGDMLCLCDLQPAHRTL